MIDKKEILSRTDFKTLYRELIPKFKETKHDQAIGLCLFHNDHHESLSLNTITGAFNCFACDAKGGPIDLCMKVWGLDFKNTLHRLAERAGIKIGNNDKASNKPRCIATFHYTDAEGKRLYRKTRYEPGWNGRKKDFLFFHGSKEKGRGCDAVPYRLHEIIKANKVFFVEGEAKADLLASWGLAATCLDSGANSKWHSRYDQFFAGKEIIIVPDNDAAGKGYLRTVATALHGKSKSIKVLRLPGLQEKQDILDWIKQEGGTTPEGLQSCKDTFLKLVDEAPEYQPPITPQVVSESAADDTEAQQPKGERGANLLFNNLVSDLNFRLVRNDTGETFAVIDHELLHLQGQEFRDFLCYRFLKDTGQPLRKEALNTVIMGLCAKARYEGELIQTPLRVGQKDNKFYFDLGRNQEGARVVEITPEGWRILVNESPILFRRGSWQKSQVNSLSGGDPWKLFNHSNIAESDRLLVLVAIIAALVPGISHPAIQVHGTQGSGKSFLAKLVKMLIDPTASTIIALPPKEEDVLLTFARHYIAPIDNVTRLSTYLCEIICSFISGGYIEKRTLHTTLDTTTIPIDCIPIFTSINSSLHERPDLSERTIKIELQHIGKKQRLRETVLLENFKKDIPEILGGMLDVISKAMQVYPGINLPELPRMADWATWGYAIAEALGEGLGKQFMDAYFKNIGLQTEDMLDDNALLSSIVSLLDKQEYITGNFKECLELLREEAKPSPNDKSFPASPRGLRRHLERIKIPLFDLGIRYEIASRTSKGRIINFSRADVVSAADDEIPF